MIRQIGRLASALSLAVLLASALPALAVEEDLLQGVGDDAPVVAVNQVDARLEYFTWREHDGDRRLLKESGPRLRLGAARAYNKSDITFTPRIDGTFGYVDYDGQTQGGTPVETKVRYVGFGVGADVGAIYHLKGDSSLEPYMGLGWSYWRRDLRSTTQATGYLETWDSFFARGGAKGEVDLKSGSKTFRGYGELGLKLPLSTYNSAKFPGVGRVKTDPKGNVSLYGSAGLKLDRWKVGLFYDSWRFQASEVTPVADGAFGLMQPKSRADIFGLEASRAF
jgi:hypothetical protein